MNTTGLPKTSTPNEGDHVIEVHAARTEVKVSPLKLVTFPGALSACKRCRCFQSRRLRSYGSDHDICNTRPHIRIDHLKASSHTPKPSHSFDVGLRSARSDRYLYRPGSGMDTCCPSSCQYTTDNRRATCNIEQLRYRTYQWMIMQLHAYVFQQWKGLCRGNAAPTSLQCEPFEACNPGMAWVVYEKRLDGRWRDRLWH